MNAKKMEKPFGLWESPITAKLSSQDLRLNEVGWNGDGGYLVWHEGRSGFGSLIAAKNNEPGVALNQGISCQGGVGYGGGEFSVFNDTVYFAGKDNRLYARRIGYDQPKPITTAYGGVASPVISPDGRWVVYVFSDGKSDYLAVVDANGEKWPQKIMSGADFYMQPKWHPQGKYLAWVEWDNPHMPWDQTRLKIAKVNQNPFPELVDIQQLAGEDDVVIFQPEFSPDGKYLSYICTQGDWDALKIVDLASGETRTLYAPENVHLMEPAWVQGKRSYAWLKDNQSIVFIQYQEGQTTLWKIDLKSKVTSQIPTSPYTFFRQVSISIHDEIAMIASAASVPARVVVWDGKNWRIAARSSSESIDPLYLSEPQAVSWLAEDQSLVYGLFYPPKNPKFTSEGKPPLIVHIHGGPTSQAVMVYDPDISYFTSRGYGWLEVNYRGSTGYGHAYEKKLRKNWGNFDVEDAVQGARSLVAKGLANEKQIIIMGGSAGGYTVYNCLIRYPGVFKAGVCLYGVSNLFTLDMDSHKFEAFYNASLIGSLPEAAGRYHAWSPVFHAEKIQDALAIFHGAEDKAVPPNQADEIISKLKQKGTPYFYKLYPGEGHGFRKEETILDFYMEVERFLQMNVLFAPE